MKYDGEYWNVVWKRPYGGYNKQHQAIWDAVVPFLKGKVLDLGCGPAMLYKGKTGIDLLGVDYSHKAIEEACKNYPYGKYMQWDVSQRIPLPDASYDTIVMFGLLDYFEDWTHLLSETRRIVKPDGKIFATLLDAFEGHNWKDKGFTKVTRGWYLYEIK